VNVGSLVGKLSGPSNGTDAATKHAVEAVTDTLRWELGPFGVQVVLVQPGAVASACEQTVVRESGSLLARNDSPYAPLYARFEKVSADMRRTQAAAEVVASVIFTAVRAEHPHARYPAAVPFQAQIAMQLPNAAKDLVVRRLYALDTPSEVTAPDEIAEGVWRLSVHDANVYFVRSEAGWVLVDAAWAWGNCAHVIRGAAEALFGPNASPTAIVLTHLHPDHDGAALELAEAWACPVYVHGDELPLAQAVAARDLAGIARYGNGLDRGVIVPIMRVLPPRPDSTHARPRLANVARRLEPDGVPGLLHWTWVPTPGHAPGHVALFRPADRVLLSGDAVLTVDASSVGGYLAWAVGRRPQHAFPPPTYTNWNQSATDASLSVLTALEPRVLATGHGAPLVGDAATHELRAVALRARSRSIGGHDASPPLARNLYNRKNGDDDRSNSECECDPQERQPHDSI
jgi:glyoxylase-like metal-dependent hydrolase (beta-lactamase superfamily II)